MARLPGAQDVQQVSSSSSRDPGVRVPAPVPSGLEQLGQSISNFSEVVYRVQERKEGIRRGRAEASYTEFLNELDRNLQDADLFDDDVVEQARQAAVAKQQELMGQFTGNSRELAELSLQNRRQTFENGLAAKSIQAMHVEQDQRFQDQVRKLARELQVDPSFTMEQAAEGIDNAIIILGVTGRKAELYRQLGRQQLSVAQVDNLITAGDFGEARQLLNQSENLPVEIRQNLHRKLASVERQSVDLVAQTRGQLQAAQMLAGEGADEETVNYIARSLAGVPGVEFQTLGNNLLAIDPMTMQLKGMIEGPTPGSRLIPPEELAAWGMPPGTVAFEKPNGLPQVIHTPDPDYGKGFSGRSAEVVRDLAPIIMSGTANEQAERNFEQAYHNLLAGVIDETGRRIYPPPSPSAQAAYEALKARGGPGGQGSVEEPATSTGSKRVPEPQTTDSVVKIPTEASGEAPNEQDVKALESMGVGVQDPLEALVEVDQIIAEGRLETPDTVEAETIPLHYRLPNLRDPEKTIADLVRAGVFTGPGPGLRRALAGLGIKAVDQRAADRTVNMLVSKLVRSLQTNPRFATSERQDVLDRIVALTPKFFEWSDNFLGSLYGIQQALYSLETELIEVLEGRREFETYEMEDPKTGRIQVSKETALHARDSLQAMQSFRKWLGPPMFMDVEALQNFRREAPPGSRAMYYDPRNNEWIFVRTQGAD